MSVRAVTFYKVVCDWPGCTATAQDEVEYAAWAQSDAAVAEAEDAGWWTGPRGVYHYCPEHPAVWEADLDEGISPEPDRPYLLIPESGGVRLIGDDQ